MGVFSSFNTFARILIDRDAREELGEIAADARRDFRRTIWDNATFLEREAKSIGAPILGAFALAAKKLLGVERQQLAQPSLDHDSVRLVWLTSHLSQEEADAVKQKHIEQFELGCTLEEMNTFIEHNMDRLQSTPSGQEIPGDTFTAYRRNILGQEGNPETARPQSPMERGLSW